MEKKLKKIIIAGLGANQYGETYYVIENKTSAKTTLGFRALADHFEIDFDDIYIVGTEKDDEAGLRGSNWGLVTKEFGRDLSKHQKVVVPFGLNQKEHYEFFAKLIGIDQPVDELIIDMTHGFRTFPVMMLMTLLFKQAIEPNTFKSIRIFYGAYEAASIIDGEFWIDHNGNNQPIKRTEMVEMKIIPDLLDWMKAAERFIQFGLGSDLADQYKKAGMKRKFEDGFTQLDNSISMNSIDHIQTSAEKLSGLMVSAEAEMPIHHPMRFIKPHVQHVLDSLSTPLVSQKQYAAAVYFIEIGRFGQASVALKEYAISIVTECLVDENDQKAIMKHQNRKPAEKFLGLLEIDENGLDEADLTLKRWICDEILKMDKSFITTFSKELALLSRIRNIFAHSKSVQYEELPGFRKKLEAMVPNAKTWLILKKLPVSFWDAFKIKT